MEKEENKTQSRALCPTCTQRVFATRFARSPIAKGQDQGDVCSSVSYTSR